MARKKRIMKYTAEDLGELVKKDGSRSDWQKAANMTDAEIEAAVASDPDEADMVMDWDNAMAELPQPNAVLRSYVKRKNQHPSHD
jgi:hypothetical protein